MSENRVGDDGGPGFKHRLDQFGVKNLGRGPQGREAPPVQDADPMGEPSRVVQVVDHD